MRLAVAVATALSVAPSAGLRADAPPCVLPVRLAVPPAVLEASRLALRREVEAIWRRVGIAIRWHEGTTSPGDVFRVLLTTADRPRSNDGHGWPVAELLRDGAGQPVAIASLPAAYRVLDAAGRRDEPSTLSARRLGLVLGRAVAHEIGHYLLATAGHRPRGLMRMRIDATDFADLREGGFWLDREAAQALQSAGPLDWLVTPLVLVAQR